MFNWQSEQYVTLSESTYVSKFSPNSGNELPLELV